MENVPFFLYILGLLIWFDISPAVIERIRKGSDNNG